jgi:hypothetical protein
VDIPHFRFLAAPQLGPHHPLPHGFLAGIDPVLVLQILCRQRRPESGVHRRRQNLHCLALGLFGEFSVRCLSAQPMNDDLVTVLLERE